MEAYCILVLSALYWTVANLVRASKKVGDSPWRRQAWTATAVGALPFWLLAFPVPESLQIVHYRLVEPTDTRPMAFVVPSHVAPLSEVVQLAALPEHLPPKGQSQRIPVALVGENARSTQLTEDADVDALPTVTGESAVVAPAAQVEGSDAEVVRRPSQPFNLRLVAPE